MTTDDNPAGAASEEMKRKFTFLGEMLERMGVPLFDESIQAVVDQFFDQIPEDLAPQTPK